MSKKESRSSVSKANIPRTKSVLGADDDNQDEKYAAPVVCYIDPEESVRPDFIYGGPFIKHEKPDPMFITTATPINLQLQGTFKKSFAYYSLKERMPVIITKIIDTLSKKGGNSEVINKISKLKNELVTNKKYTHLEMDTKDAKRWNEWIDATANQYFFTNAWVFTESYVYRKIWDICEKGGLKNVDYFADQKHKSFSTNLEPMCHVAEKLVTMVEESDKDKRKADFVTLLKLCLWSNKCDLSLTNGEPAPLKSGAPVPPVKSNSSIKGAQGQAASEEMSPCVALDPFQMAIDLKDKVLVDDSGKIYDQLCAKAEAMAKNIEGAPTSKRSVVISEGGKSPPKSPPAEPSGGEGEGEEVEQIPCPAKMTIPSAVIFDIVCDNSGYELFMDLCIAYFLVKHEIVQKVRFHVKKIPWFVSDVTPADFKYVMDSCASAQFSKTYDPEPQPEPKEGEEPPEPEPPRQVTSAQLQQLAAEWDQYYRDGTFIVMADDFWTSPHTYNKMKAVDPLLYRKLQFAVAAMYKGDLNYRKLLGEKNWNPCNGFENSLQGFIPSPILALRTVKAELICGLPKGKYEQINAIDQQWMRKGDYGVIQFCGKTEALKVSDRPCPDYGEECFGTICPVHTDL